MAALRLDIGSGLDRLVAINGHHDLGFSSLGAYVRERLDRCPRWGQEARGLVSRVAHLPKIRRALREGRLGWSMASELARIATPEDEEAWLRRSEKSTVREMHTIIEMLRETARHERPDESEAPTAGQPSTEGDGDGRSSSDRAEGKGTNEASTRTDPEAISRPVQGSVSSTEGDERFQVLTVTVDRQDAWLYECARMIVGRISGGRTTCVSGRKRPARSGPSVPPDAA